MVPDGEPSAPSWRGGRPQKKIPHLMATCGTLFFCSRLRASSIMIVAATLAPSENPMSPSNGPFKLR